MRGEDREERGGVGGPGEPWLTPPWSPEECAEQLEQLDAMLVPGAHPAALPTPGTGAWRGGGGSPCIRLDGHCWPCLIGNCSGEAPGAQGPGAGAPVVSLSAPSPPHLRAGDPARAPP